MALTWSIEECKDYKKLTTDEEWPVTNTLIWMTMIVGIREISEKTIPEFLARVRFVEKLNGTFFSKDGKNVFIQKEWVMKRIGLKTNQINMTSNQFVKRKVDGWFGDNVIKLNEAKNAI